MTAVSLNYLLAIVKPQEIKYWGSEVNIKYRASWHMANLKILKTAHNYRVAVI